MRTVWLALFAAACGSAPAANATFWGPIPEPPRGLDKIHPGMSVAEARRAVPGLKQATDSIRDELELDSHTKDVKLLVRVDNGTVSSIVAIAQGHNARDQLEQAWGKPVITHDSLGQPETTWASESTGWKVKLDCLEPNCRVEYWPYHVLTSDFFGPHVVPPGELSKLRIGMKHAEAKLIAPGPVAARNGVATEVDGVREFVTIDDRSSTVKQIYINLPQHAEDLVVEAWGKGWDATYQSNLVTVWPDSETGWRAMLLPALGFSHDLEYDNYLPAPQLFGDDPDKLGALPEPVLGKTVDEVKRAYKDQVTVVTLNRELAITLPPTEWDLAPQATTRVELTRAGGKVKELTFAVPYRAQRDAHDALLELFKTKWGDPKELDDDGKDGKGKMLLFREEDPRVEIREDITRGAWQVVMR